MERVVKILFYFPVVLFEYPSRQSHAPKCNFSWCLWIPLIWLLRKWSSRVQTETVNSQCWLDFDFKVGPDSWDDGKVSKRENYFPCFRAWLDWYYCKSYDKHCALNFPRLHPPTHLDYSPQNYFWSLSLSSNSVYYLNVWHLTFAFSSDIPSKNFVDFL